MSPQHVVVGKPNCALSWPEGMGAGVECKVASLEARDGPEEEEREVRVRKSVMRKEVLPEEREP